LALQPRLRKRIRFRLLRVRSPLLAESLRFLFLWLLRCFSSPGAPLTSYFVHSWVPRHYSERISPFGYPGINASVLLPREYRCFRALRRRSVPRHSSCTLFSSSNFYKKLSSFPPDQDNDGRPPISRKNSTHSRSRRSVRFYSNHYETVNVQTTLAKAPFLVRYPSLPSRLDTQFKRVETQGHLRATDSDDTTSSARRATGAGIS
jgi:hypothetical protein